MQRRYTRYIKVDYWQTDLFRPNYGCLAEVTPFYNIMASIIRLLVVLTSSRNRAYNVCFCTTILSMA